MQIVKKDSYRSQGSAVNKTDDMYRVVVDMKRTEYPQFAKLVEENGLSHNKAAEARQTQTNMPTTPCQHTFKVFSTAVMCTKCRCVYDLSE